MKISLNAVGLLVGLTLAKFAMADEAKVPANVSAEKKSALQQLLPGVYGKVDVRQDFLRADVGTTKAYDHTSVDFLPKLGMTLFDDKVDTSFTWWFKQNSSTNTVSKHDFYNETQWNWLAGEFNENSPFNFGPYAWIDFLGAVGNSTFSYADVGFYGEVNYQFAIPTGALALQVYEQPLEEFVTAADNQAPDAQLPLGNDKGANQTGASLNGESVSQARVTTNQRDPLIINYAGTNALYKPQAIKGLAAGIGIDLVNTWKPKYRAVTADGQDSVEKAGYSTGVLTMNRLILSYKISDKVTVSNQTRAYLRGYDQRTVDVNNPDPTGQVGPYKWENRLALVATLF